MRRDRLLGHDQETGRVVLGILDIGAKRDQAIDVTGKLRSDHRLGHVTLLGNASGGPRGVNVDHRLQPQFTNQVPALIEGMDVTVHVG
jgi:hypothetical protein